MIQRIVGWYRWFRLGAAGRELVRLGMVMHLARTFEEFMQKQGNEVGFQIIPMGWRRF